MPFTYAPVNTLHASYVFPSDGDPAIAESVNVAFEALADTALYVNTQVSHQAFDDRGKTSSITGPIVLNDAGGSVTWNIAQTVNRDVDISGAKLAIHSDADFSCAANNARFTGDLLTVGNTGTDALVVNGTTDLFALLSVHDDVVAGHNLTVIDQLVGNGGAVITGGNSQIGNPGSGFTFTVGDPLRVSGNADFFADVNVAGSTELGNNSTAEHNVNGHIFCNDDLTVGGNTHLGGNLVVDGGAGDNEIHDTTTFFGDVGLHGDTEIGSSASDSLTINALVVTPVMFGTSGRIVLKPTIGPDSNTSVYVTATNLVYVPVAGLGGHRTYILQDSGSVSGDEIIVSTADTTSLLTVQGETGDSVTLGPASAGRTSWTWFVRIGSTWRSIAVGS